MTMIEYTGEIAFADGKTSIVLSGRKRMLIVDKALASSLVTSGVGALDNGAAYYCGVATAKTKDGKKINTPLTGVLDLAITDVNNPEAFKDLSAAVPSLPDNPIDQTPPLAGT